MLLAGILVCAFAGRASAAPWPMYRGDAGRMNYTPEDLPDTPSLLWVYKPGHPPMPAWPAEPKMTFDRGHHAVADDARVYFGSTADGKVYALDAATGEERWAFFTDAPVRFAPALWRDRLFAVSDDGRLYCLRAADGELLWKYRPAPSGRMVLGNGRMISKWPARGGPAVVDDVVYFGAGIWPSEKVYICALQAETGEPVWINDTSGSVVMPQPHAINPIDSGVSCQGYLAAAGDRLFVPTGRGVPAAFNRADGTFLYNRLHDFRTQGGTEIAAVDSMLFNADLMLSAEDGKRVDFFYRYGIYIKAGGVNTALLAATPEHIYTSAVSRFDRARPIKPWVDERERSDGSVSRVERPGLNGDWSFRIGQRGEKTSLIVAGDTVVVGGQGFVTAVAAGGKNTLWTHPIDGTALSLAVAGRRLFVCTDNGPLYCFGSGDKAGAVIEPKTVEDPYPANGPWAAAAKEIVEKTGVTEGYCLDLGCGDGRLAFELAKRTRLNIYCIESDPAKVALARKRLDAAGLYGVRVTIHHGDPSRTDYPNYFADLVVSGNSLTGAPVPEEELRRCQRPCGGVACVGKPGAMVATVRGPLEGAGQWTHQYADPANTACSDDARLKAPLTVLWFDAVDQAMPDRHGRAPAPLVADGRLYVQGLHDLRAFNAYNGRQIWQRPIKGVGDAYHTFAKYGASVAGSNLCTDGKIIYVRQANRCLRIDGATGNIVGEFSTPADKGDTPPAWGYVACEDGLLFGSIADEGHVVRGEYRRSPPKLYNESKALFAMDAAAGTVKWQYGAKDSIRHNAIAVGGGTVYLIDRVKSESDVLSYTRTRPHPTGVLLALDAATGREKWRAAKDIFGTTLTLSLKHDVLLMSYTRGPTSQTLKSEKSELNDNLAAFRASTGERLWHTKGNYATRPVVIDRTIYFNPFAYDLLTGKQVENYHFTRSYGCGTIAGARHFLTFRSASLGYRDLSDDVGTRHFGGVRAGCWINAIPAGGLVLLPDFTAGCECAYQMKTSLALERGE